ncbi:MAG: SDR family NAD(P)-dependent oxidoreductase [Calditrichaeota bacterium]|nr:MAG: SDR family NAD(P)-dependent oxidoreductase [Calditrichota bacterium]
MSNTFKGKVAIITGASRGIGKAIALKLAEEGMNIAVGAKTVERSEKTPGTIYETVAAVEAKGAAALAVPTDVRFAEQVQNLVQKTVERFGRLDVVINNAGAILWRPVEEMPVKRFDLMMQINYRAPFLLCHEAIPFLKKQKAGHIINMSPPPKIGALAAEAWAGRTCYLMSKFGMSHLTLGLAEELREANIAVNSLWPASIIDTQATRVFAPMFGIDESTVWYSPQLLADACAEILRTAPQDLTGQTLIAEDFLRSRGISDLTQYRVASPV